MDQNLCKPIRTGQRLAPMCQWSGLYERPVHHACWRSGSLQIITRKLRVAQDVLPILVAFRSTYLRVKPQCTLCTDLVTNRSSRSDGSFRFLRPSAFDEMVEVSISYSSACSNSRATATTLRSALCRWSQAQQLTAPASRGTHTSGEDLFSRSNWSIQLMIYSEMTTIAISILSRKECIRAKLSWGFCRNFGYEGTYIYICILCFFVFFVFFCRIASGGSLILL